MVVIALAQFLHTEVTQRTHWQNISCQTHIDQIQQLVHKRIKQLQGLEPLFSDQTTHNSSVKLEALQQDANFDWNTFKSRRQDLWTIITPPQIHDNCSQNQSKTQESLSLDTSDHTTNVQVTAEREISQPTDRLKVFSSTSSVKSFAVKSERHAHFAQSTLCSSKKYNQKHGAEIPEVNGNRALNTRPRHLDNIVEVVRHLEEHPVETGDPLQDTLEKGSVLSEASFDSTLRSQTLEDLFKDAASTGRFSNASSISFVSNSSLKSARTVGSTKAKTNSLFKRLLELKQQSSKSKDSADHRNRTAALVTGPLISSSGINLPQIPSKSLHNRGKEKQNMKQYMEPKLKYSLKGDADTQYTPSKESDIHDDDSGVCSEEDDDCQVLRHVRKNRLVAQWAKASTLKKSLLRQRAIGVDPDTIFGCTPDDSLVKLPEAWEKDVFRRV